MSEVKVGQVWKDMDKRMNNRRLTVIKVDAEYAYLVPEFQARLGTWKRMSRVKLRRMKPTSTGYALVQESIK